MSPQIYCYGLCLLLQTLYHNVSSGQERKISLFFDTDQDRVTAAHMEHIGQVLSDTDSVEQWIIEVVGYADHRGEDSYNMALSARRAQAIAAYLQSEYGDRIDRMHTRAGGEMPGSSDLSMYRRVDVTFISAIHHMRLKGILAPGEIPLEELKSGSLLHIKNLNFRPGRHLLLPQSIPHLKDLETFLKANPSIHMEIQGHVCCPDQIEDAEDGYNVDTKKYNLSVSRAENIYHYLVRSGIDSLRLSYRGFGSTQPLIYPELSEDDKVQNRRVELLITKI